MTNRDALERLGARLVLPTLPEVVVKINRMLVDPRVGAREIGAVIGDDPSLTAEVLRIANSAFYGPSEPVLSPEQAAVVIGLQALRNVAMQTSIMNRFQRFENYPDFDLADLWSHAQEVAQLSRALAQLTSLTGGLSAEDYYTCGLLHDVGKVLLLDALGDEYLGVVCMARDTHRTVHDCEREALGFTHVDVGALLAKRWKLPAGIVSAIEFHHGPPEAMLADQAGAIVSLADQVSYHSKARDLQASGAWLAELAWRTLGVAPERFRAVLDLVGEVGPAPAHDETEAAPA